MPPLSDRPNQSTNSYLFTHGATIGPERDNLTNDLSGGPDERRDTVRRRRERNNDNEQRRRRTRPRLNTAAVETASVATQTPREDSWGQETDDSDDDDEDGDDSEAPIPTDEWRRRVERRQREEALIDLTNCIFELIVLLCVIRLIRIRYD